MYCMAVLCLVLFVCGAAEADDGSPSFATITVSVTFDAHPDALAITPTTPSPSNSSTISFLVLFSEAVSNFEGEEDLVITETGSLSHSGASITDGPQDYVVNVTGVSGDGELRLAVSTGSDVQDLSGNPLASSVTSGPVVADTIAPSAEITLLTTTPSGADVVEFEVAFDEPVGPTFDSGDVGLTGMLDGAVSVTGADPTYTVAVTLLDPDEDGTVGIEVGGGVTDPAGNPYAGGLSPLCEIYNWHGFIAEPQDVRAYTGDSPTFAVTVDCGASTVSYQWKWDDGFAKTVHDVGVDSPSYTVVTATPANRGDYWCEVSYDGETHPSTAAILEVENHVEIAEQPEGAEKRVGESHTFKVAATGGYQPLAYTWMKHGEAITGATEPAYTIPSLQESDSGTYAVQVQDSNTDVRVSAPAVLVVTLGLPASGAAALTILLGLLALAGALAARRGLGSGLALRHGPW